MKQKVLIVEDDDIFSEIVASIFEFAGYKTMVANDGNQGYKFFEEFKPDCVVTDIVMPIQNGVQLARKIFSSTNPVPVALMSGYTNNTDIKELEKSPFWMGFFAKPFEEEKLLLAVRQALAKSPA